MHYLLSVFYEFFHINLCPQEDLGRKGEGTGALAETVYYLHLSVAAPQYQELERVAQTLKENSGTTKLSHQNKFVPEV